MATYVLNAYSTAWPFVVNRIRASVRSQSSPLAIIASIIDTANGHPQRIYTFSGLPRDNYIFLLEEIDTNDQVVNTLADFDVVPGQTEGLLSRNDEQIRVGDTNSGLVEGETVATFDGTGGKPDYRGFIIVPSELTGRGILVLGIDYTWDSVNGIFTLVQPGDIFQNGLVYNIHFNPIQSSVPDSVPTINDFQIFLVTDNYNILASDFGKKMIIEAIGNYIELSLPDINTVPQGRRLMVEVGGQNFCARFNPAGSTKINFLRGNLFALPFEKFSIYSFSHQIRGLEWRVSDESGNFSFCGNIVSQDSLVGNLFNVNLQNGDIVSTLSKFARLYNEIVLNLPLNQVCNFDDWNTGNNKYLYSKANSSNPANLNKFHLPNRLGLFERNNNTGKAGDFGADSVGSHSHPIKYILEGNDGTPTASGQVLMKYDGDGHGSGQGGSGVNNYAISNNIGTETAPAHYLINKYIVL